MCYCVVLFVWFVSVVLFVLGVCLGLRYSCCCVLFVRCLVIACLCCRACCCVCDCVRFFVRVLMCSVVLCVLSGVLLLVWFV